MAVASLKGCWYKFSARIRDYIEVVDSYYRPTDDPNDNSTKLRDSTNKTRHNCDRDNISNHISHKGKRSHHNHQTKSSHRSNHHHSHQRTSHHHNYNSADNRNHHNHHNHHHHNCQEHCTSQENKLGRSQLPPGFTKRKTSDGQVYFLDLSGHKHWYDPSVPKELLTASLNLNLDSIVGQLSDDWEIRRTSNGKIYYVDHIKQTTQFTDPRLVAYKDQLMNFLKHSKNSSSNNNTNNNCNNITSNLNQSININNRNNSQNVQLDANQEASLSNEECRLTCPNHHGYNQRLPDNHRNNSNTLQNNTLTLATIRSLRRNIRLTSQLCGSVGNISLLGPIPSFNHGQHPKANKELFDKISILRQELLKQQVLAHPCRIDVNRKRIFEESFRVVSQMRPRDLKKRLLVKFRGEEGLDYGGVAREWFFLLSRKILNPMHGLFQYTSNDIYNLQLNPDSGIVYKEHLSYLNFCGRIIGMAVFHGHFIEGRFTRPFYKMLLKKPINLSDIEFVDPDLYRSLCWILDNDITNVIDTTFLVQHNALGQLQEYELIENGRNINVTETNKHEYVSLYVNYRCRRGIENQFEALQRGFYELIPESLIENFDEEELELLIGGQSKIDIEDWRLHTKLKNCTVDTPLVRWFWDIVKSYSEDKRARLLQFVTGSPRVPIQGFKALQGVNSELRLFTIHLIKNAFTDNLPKSHTCFNRIDLPPYENYDKLRDKLTQAIEETMGFAMQ